MNRVLARAAALAAPRLARGPQLRMGSTVLARSSDRDADAPKKAKDGQPSMFRSSIVVGGTHKFVADEPEKLNGAGEGPNPYDFLLAALGSCTTMTIKMYAERKGLSEALEGITVELSHKKVHAADCADCGSLGEVAAKGKKIDRIERNITIVGERLTPEQRQRMFEIANMCPVHNTLKQSSVVVSKLVA